VGTGLPHVHPRPRMPPAAPGWWERTSDRGVSGCPPLVVPSCGEPLVSRVQPPHDGFMRLFPPARTAERAVMRCSGREYDLSRCLTVLHSPQALGRVAERKLGPDSWFDALQIHVGKEFGEF